MWSKCGELPFPKDTPKYSNNVMCLEKLKFLSKLKEDMNYATVEKCINGNESMVSYMAKNGDTINPIPVSTYHLQPRMCQ